MKHATSESTSHRYHSHNPILMPPVISWVRNPCLIFSLSLVPFRRVPLPVAIVSWPSIYLLSWAVISIKWSSRVIRAAINIQVFSIHWSFIVVWPSVSFIRRKLFIWRHPVSFICRHSVSFIWRHVSPSVVWPPSVSGQRRVGRVGLCSGPFYCADEVAMGYQTA